MSQRSRIASYTKNRAALTRRENNRIYIDGNAVRQWEPRRPLEEPARRTGADVGKNRRKAHHMSGGYLFFLGMALVMSAMILMNYLHLQAELTNLSRSVTARQSSLNKLRSENDDEYNRIVRSQNLEEIRRVAIGELGMTYAQEGQIIVYESGQYDYMRRVTGNSR